MKWRFAIVLLSTCFFLILIGYSFWQQDWQYSLPTPRPQGLDQLAIGETVDLASTSLPSDISRPISLHFFNPGCPCSRFNVDHIRSLIQSYKSKVRFIAILQGDEPHLSEAFSKLGLNIESVVDSDGSIAKATGVYATPQAVIIDQQNRLYYRGNYNASRYCAIKETEFARIALETLLDGKPPPQIPAAASTAYGCPLPKKQSLKAASAS